MAWKHLLWRGKRVSVCITEILSNGTKRRERVHNRKRKSSLSLGGNQQRIMSAYSYICEGKKEHVQFLHKGFLNTSDKKNIFIY